MSPRILSLRGKGRSPGEARVFALGLLALFALPALTACGGDGSSGAGGGASGPPKVDGIYSITRHTESHAMAGGPSATCTKEGADVAGPGFLRLALTDTDRLGWGLCASSSDLGTCSDEFYTFNDVSGGWAIGAATSASESGDLCTLYHAEGGVTLLGGDPKKVRLEIKEWNAYPMMGERPCTLDSAKALSGDADCAEHIVIEATAL